MELFLMHNIPILFFLPFVHCLLIKQLYIRDFYKSVLTGVLFGLAAVLSHFVGHNIFPDPFNIYKKRCG